MRRVAFKVISRENAAAQKWCLVKEAHSLASERAGNMIQEMQRH